MPDVDVREHDPVHMADVMLKALVRVNDSYLEVAIIALLEQDGVGVTSQDNGETFLVTDDVRQLSRRTVLIAEETVGASRNAIEALVGGRLGALVSRSDPSHLPLAIKSLARGVVTLPQNLLNAAGTGPGLEPRQRQVLSLVAAGLSNARIAERLSVSEATVKRDVSGLLRYFGCHSRLELVREATSVGYA